MKLALKIVDTLNFRAKISRLQIPFDEHLLNFCVWRGAKECKPCRSRRNLMLKYAPALPLRGPHRQERAVEVREVTNKEIVATEASCALG